MLSAAKLGLIGLGGAVAVGAVVATVVVNRQPRSHASSSASSISGSSRALKRPPSDEQKPTGAPLLPLPPVKAISLPAADPASCKVAHERAVALLKEFDGLVDPQVRAAAEAYVGQRPPGSSQGKAYDDFAVALLVQGDAQDAAWCGLKAISIEWRLDQVTNCAVYLIYLDRLQDALSILNCAYASDYRSPYLFEALAVAFRRMGNHAKARESIIIAHEMAPHDPAIMVEKSLETTGGPPPSSPDSGRQQDCLDKALGEFDRHTEYVIAQMRALATDLDRIEGDPAAKRFRDGLLEIAFKSLRYQAGVVHQMVERGRDSRDQRAQQVHWNMAILFCISEYIRQTDEMISVFADKHVDGPGLQVLFWAHTLSTDAHDLEQEQKLGSDSDAARWHGPEYAYHMQYQKAKYDADEKHRKGFDACTEIKNEPARKACYIRSDVEWCAAVAAAYNSFADQTKERLNIAADRFDSVARDTTTWGQHQILDARNYSVRYFSCLRLEKDSHVAPDKNRANALGAEFYSRSVNTHYSMLLKRLLDPNNATWSLAKRLKEEARWFATHRESVLETLEQERSSIINSNNGCTDIQQRYLKLLADEAWKQYLDSLKDNLKGDFQASYDDTGNCQFSIGPLEYGIDDTGKRSATFKVKNFFKGLELKPEASIKDGTFTGVSIGLGRDIYDYPPFAAKADGNIFVEKNEKTGKWDTGFVLSGSIGLGAEKNLVHLFGRDFDISIACYPGSVSAKFYARAFFDHAVEYIKAELSHQ